jgi:enamine deaminase RidA (YjgF/YER057c/UK114 family)
MEEGVRCVISHVLKSATAQSNSRVKSASLVVLGDTAYMTVIPPLPINPAMSAADQARLILQEIETRLTTIGSDKRNIAQITIWLSDVSYFDEVTAVWNDWIDPEHPPVRACAQVGIPNKDLKVEMIVIAHAPFAANG